MTEHIRTELNNISVPDSLHARAELGMEQAIKEQKGTIIPMKSHRKAIAAVAALFLTVGIFAGSNTALAKDIRGFFSDVVRFDGAVVGTEYHNATDEIAVTAEAVDNTVTVNVQFLYPNDAPYASIFMTGLSLRNVILTNSSEETLMTIEETEITPIENGFVSVDIPMGTVTLSSGTEYTLVFDTAVGHAKADQPLPMSGNWSCTFIAP